MGSVIGISVRTTPQWAEWFREFSEATRIPRPSLADMALQDLAGKLGFPPPPRRCGQDRPSN